MSPRNNFTVDNSTIDLASSEGLDGMKVFNMKPQVDRFVFPDVFRVLVLASGQLLNLECATGHHSLVIGRSALSPSRRTEQ